MAVLQGDHSHLLDRLSHVYSQLRGSGRATSSSDEEGLPGLMLRGSAAARSTSFAGSDYGAASSYGPDSRVTRRWATPSMSMPGHTRSTPWCASSRIGQCLETAAAETALGV